ncbi:hypothetical protein PHMEG_00012273 [Phytophthora megakarya]|uniref:BZIP domain-containing protein n=1 Tax=Phytophthora megakarya TaxID=4795 RepID=A0A225W9L2_9STRA|nr:hypothetical protein PHMEG_00012273 [Phytophthora megakarya]
MMSTVAELVGETDSSTGRKRFSSDLKTANEIIASIHGSSYEITDELQNAIVTETLKRKNRIRENRRTYQARYREKKIKIEKEIQNNVRNLRYEIGKLRQKRSAISHFPSPPMIWSIATEYLRLFNHYISTPAAMQSTASNFLHNILAPDVMVGTLFGMNSLLDHWKMFALFFDDPQLELKGSEELTQVLTELDISLDKEYTSSNSSYEGEKAAAVGGVSLQSIDTESTPKEAQAVTAGEPKADQSYTEERPYGE